MKRVPFKLSKITRELNRLFNFILDCNQTDTYTNAYISIRDNNGNKICQLGIFRTVWADKTNSIRIYMDYEDIIRLCFTPDKSQLNKQYAKEIAKEYRKAYKDAWKLIKGE